MNRVPDASLTPSMCILQEFDGLQWIIKEDWLGIFSIRLNAKFEGVADPELNSYGILRSNYLLGSNDSKKELVVSLSLDSKTRVT